MRHILRQILLPLGLLLLTLAVPGRALAQCPGNLLANFSFEEGLYKGETVGTSLSSWLSVNWLPWAVLGDQQTNREIEYFVVDSQVLAEGTYRVHHGRYAQKFFSGYSTHHAGFYQRVAVPRGQQVTFSIWVQIATGQREFWSWGLPVSDLEQPGNYKVWAGIDPYGGTPPGFGALPPETTVWSNPVIDRETRMVTADGKEYDAWVQLTVSTIAQSDYVTVYTRGQPEFPVKNNSSFWDDACLYVSAPPTATPAPTSTPTETPSVTETPVPTETPLPTDTPAPTQTARPTQTQRPTASPTATFTPTETATLAPTATETQAPTLAPSPTSAPATATAIPPAEGGTGSGGPSNGLLLAGAGLGAAAVVFAAARLRRRR